MNKFRIDRNIFFVMILGISITSCQSPTEKVDEAKTNVTEAKQDLQQAQKEADSEVIKIADELQWKMFKDETEVKIKDNEILIKSLKAKRSNKDQANDVAYTSQINALELENSNFKDRMYKYETNKSDWESFKREFNHDMDELGKALKDFSVNNKK
jgi:hypothetical protein